MRTALVSLLVAFLLITTPPAFAQSAPDDTLGVASLAPWSRSIVCPVLYAHEVVSQAALRRFVTTLLSLGYQPTTLATVDDAMAGLVDPPRGCIVLTFDDALMSQYQNALPVLSDMGVPAVFFVLPGFRDGVHRYMGVAEIQALAAAGFEVEAHTCNHPSLPLLARRNLQAFFAEIGDCKRIVEDIAGQPVRFLAYPNGAFDAPTMDAAARFGYRAAFTTRPSAYLSASAPFALPRIRFDPSEAPAIVLNRIRGAGG